jgi:[lysine-biosynthesis-protein LysW]--L-2-aminoadipate ligase
MRFGIVAHRASETNLGLAASAPPGCRAFVLDPNSAFRELEPGEAALGRLDVLDTVDGIEPGLALLELLAACGVTVLNSATALRLSHDKGATAGALHGANLPHPATRFVERDYGDAPLPFPLVLKPHFGSWGRDVMLCSDERDYEHALRTLSVRPWFRRTGAVAQELIPPLGHDLRVLVAGGEVVGAVKRVAAPGEWRTNVALGATRIPTEPPANACALALAAAAALGADLVGVDLLPLGTGDFVVLEVNGAVDFGEVYAPGQDVFASAMRALGRRLFAVERKPLTAVA